MLKLYKTVRGRVHYWEAWKDGAKLVVHTGPLGRRGVSRRVALARGETERAALKRCSQAPRADGYAPIADDDHKMLVVQYAVEGWGSVDDLDFREAVYAILQEALGWTGNGHCDGGDIGSGTINLFSFVIDAGLAVDAIVPALRKAKRLSGAVIASSSSSVVTAKMKVHWPRGYKQRFTTDA